MQPQPVTALPGNNAAAVTPSDTAQFPSSMIYVGVSGNVAVMPADQEGRTSPTAVTFVGMSAGDTVPVLCSRVMSTNTTATNLVRIF